MKFKFQIPKVKKLDIEAFVIDWSFACLPAGRDFDI